MCKRNNESDEQASPIKLFIPRHIFLEIVQASFYYVQQIPIANSIFIISHKPIDFFLLKKLPKIIFKSLKQEYLRKTIFFLFIVKPNQIIKQ